MSIAHRRIYNADVDTVPPDAILVDRTTRFGNRFKLGIDGDIEQVKELYIDYLLKNPSLIEDIKTTLRDKDLVCHCHPEPCHAALILKIANDPDFELNAKRTMLNKSALF